MRVRRRETGGDLIYDWGGGLIWAAVPPSQDAQATMVRDRTIAIGGKHVTRLKPHQRKIGMVFQA